MNKIKKYYNNFIKLLKKPNVTDIIYQLSRNQYKIDKYVEKKYFKVIKKIKSHKNYLCEFESDFTMFSKIYLLFDKTINNYSTFIIKQQRANSVHLYLYVEQEQMTIEEFIKTILDITYENYYRYDNSKLIDIHLEHMDVEDIDVDDYKNDYNLLFKLIKSYEIK